MGVRQVADGHYRQQASLARRVARSLGRLWRRVAPQDIAGSWRDQLPEAFATVTAGQYAAAQSSTAYVAAALSAQRASTESAGRVNAAALAGIASDGRDLESLLYRPAITALTTIGRGADVQRSLAAGAVELDMIVRTQVADAGRVGDGVATTSAAVGGYVRMLTLPSCSRCIILAGVFYEWNAGFPRHPQCDCRHIPADEDVDDDLRTDPQALFDAMTEAEQAKVFTIAGAQAIRDGADMNQVVNARRGMATAGETRTRVRTDGLVVNVSIRRQTTARVAGRDVFTTVEAAGRRPRLMPEQIYLEAAGDRDEAIRLLRLHGYLF